MAFALRGVVMSNDIRKMAVLGGEQSIRILMVLSDNRWLTASEVAKRLGIHIATAVKYLAALHEAGIVGRKKRVCKTREAFEYNLTSPKIEVSIELDKVGKEREDISAEEVRFYFSLLHAILNKAKKVSGNLYAELVEKSIGMMDVRGFEKLKSRMDFEKELSEAVSDFESRIDPRNMNALKPVLLSMIEKAVRTSEQRIGRLPTNALITASTRTIIENNSEIVAKRNLLVLLPAGYFWR